MTTPKTQSTPPLAAVRAWTPAQQAAIEHVEGDLLVSAAAGSGKTAVLAERCARLVTMPGPQRSSIERLLVVTFTEAAATEMRARIAHELRKRIEAAGESPDLLRQAALIDRAAISTLHGFCTRTLRAYFHEVAGEGGIPLDPSFEIIDADEANLLQDEILDSILRRHHMADVALSQTQPAARSGFAALLESHAQGTDSTLKDFVLDLHKMLVTLRSPADWLAEARLQYTSEGVAKVLAQFAAQIAAQLHLEAARASDDVSRLNKIPGTQALSAPLKGFQETIESAAAALGAGGIQGWENAKTHLHSFTWPARITTNKDVADFAALKKETYEKAKQTLDKLQSQTFGDNQSAATLRASLLSLAPAANALIDLADEFDRAFTAAKRAQNRLDFADLERLTLDLLTRPGARAAADLRARFDHVLVDEFQDINPLQAALLEAVRSPEAFAGKGNLFVVGDVKQSIYGFRLADPQEFLTLESRLRAVKTHRAFLPLQHNFRTAPHLLSNMNALFAKLLTREVAGVDYTGEHQLHAPPASPHPAPDAPPIELIVVVPPDAAADDSDETTDDADAPTSVNSEPPSPTLQLTSNEREARHVAEKIAALIAAGTLITPKEGPPRPLQYRDIAILLRSVKNRALLFARALAEHNIPVHADLSTGYFDAQEIRDTLALLAVLDNPYQDIPLATLLLSPIARFTHDDLALIRLAYPKRADVSFHQAVHRFMLESPASAAGDLPARLHSFFARLDRYRNRARILPLHDALAEMLDDTGLLTYVAGLPAGAQRIANLHALHHRARQFSGFRRQGLYRFLRFIERLRQSDSDFGEAPILSEASDVVRIMSVHKSKGLEFPVVFVCTLGSKFNLDSARPVIVDRDHHLALAAADEDKNIFIPTALTTMAVATSRRHAHAEELRLLYVALTRARERLILTAAAKPDAWDKAKAKWSHHTGPLPSYHLLRANSFLDYLLPAAALPQMSAAINVQVVPVAAPPADIAPSSSSLSSSFSSSPSSSSTIAALVARLDYRYPFMPLAQTPALFTVTELKKRIERHAELADEESAPRIPPALPSQPARSATPVDSSGRTAAIARGIATHRLLELLDFATVHSPQTLDAAIANLVVRGILTPPQAAVLDRPSILWFLQSPPADRLRRIAAEAPSRILREVPFVFSLDVAEVLEFPLPPGLSTADRRDMPQLRGVIDLLLLDGATAEILDYKTDSPYTLAASLPMYRRQMHYYMRAVSACLSLRISGAILVCLSTRQLETIPPPPSGLLSPLAPNPPAG